MQPTKETLYLLKQRAMKTCSDLISLEPLFLDTETSTFADDARVIDICIMELGGTVLFESLVNPEHHISLFCTEVHGMRDEDVKDAPIWPRILPTIHKMLMTREFVMYNAKYDFGRICEMYSSYQFAIPMMRLNDLMRIYAEYHGEWYPQTNAYKFQKLTVACAQMGIPMEEELAHRAKYDCDLTRRLLLKLGGEYGRLPRPGICTF